jgi:hypothetical protein
MATEAAEVVLQALAWVHCLAFWKRGCWGVLRSSAGCQFVCLVESRDKSGHKLVGPLGDSTKTTQRMSHSSELVIEVPCTA